MRRVSRSTCEEVLGRNWDEDRGFAGRLGTGPRNGTADGRGARAAGAGRVLAPGRGALVVILPGFTATHVLLCLSQM